MISSERKKFTGEEMNTIFAEAIKSNKQPWKYHIKLTQKKINSAFAYAIKTIDQENVNKLLFYWFTPSQIEDILERTWTGSANFLDMVIREVEHIYGVLTVMNKELIQQIKSHLEQMFLEIKMPSTQEMSDYLDFQNKLENDEIIDI